MLAAGFPGLIIGMVVAWALTGGGRRPRTLPVAAMLLAALVATMLIAVLLELLARPGGSPACRHSLPPADCRTRCGLGPPPAPDTPAAIAAQAEVSSPSWYQLALTIAEALAVVNSVVVGGVAGLAVQAGTGTLAGRPRRG